ncbi:MAG: protein kinase [Thermoanaerobaculia bacterium]
MDPPLDRSAIRLSRSLLSPAEILSALPTDIAEEHLTSAGSAVGTVAYMAPEQARGEELDARADLFSFGAVLYEMATSRQAFSGNTAAVIHDAILNRDPVAPARWNPALPQDVERLIAKALEKDREMRYQTAAELRADLKRAKRDSESAARAIVGGAAVRREIPPRPRPSRAAAAAVAAIALLVLGGLWLLRSRRASAPPRSEWTQLTHFTDSVTSPALSPDGRMISSSDDLGELRPVFGPAGDLFFRGDDGKTNRPYRMKEDGSGRQRIVEDAVGALTSVSPDGEWIALRSWSVSGGEPGGGLQVLAYPVRGGPPVKICEGCRLVKWSADGKSLYFSYIGMGIWTTTGKTFALPIRPGRALPDLPASGVRSKAEAATLPGVHVIEHGNISPGRDPSVYAFTRISAHRNLYRVPVP